MKTKIIVAALLMVMAGMFTFMRTKNAPPSDLRDAVAEGRQDFTGEIRDVEEAIKDVSSPVSAAIPEKTYAWDNQTPGMTSAASKFFSVPDQLEKIYIINLNVDKLQLSLQQGQCENLVLVRTAFTPKKVTLIINGDIQIKFDFSNAEKFRHARKAFAYYLFHVGGGKYNLVPFTGASNEKIASSSFNAHNFTVTEQR
jgi:hypothetical protein